MKVLIIVIVLLFAIKINSQYNTHLFKVNIGDNALMCPNLGPKLKVNIKQVGGNIILFDEKESVMIIELDSLKNIDNKNKYISDVIELTGYPKPLISVKSIKEEEVKLFLNKEDE